MHLEIGHATYTVPDTLYYQILYITDTRKLFSCGAHSVPLSVKINILILIKLTWNSRYPRFTILTESLFAQLSQCRRMLEYFDLFWNWIYSAILIWLKKVLTGQSWSRKADFSQARFFAQNLYSYVFVKYHLHIGVLSCDVWPTSYLSDMTIKIRETAKEGLVRIIVISARSQPINNSHGKLKVCYSYPTYQIYYWVTCTSIINHVFSFVNSWSRRSDLII